MFLRKGLSFSFLFFFLFFFFPKNVYAAGTVVITDFPEQAQITQEFSVEFSVTGLDVESSYFAKCRIGDTENHLIYAETFNNSWLGDGTSWGLLPVVISNDSGNLTSTIKVKVKTTAQSGDNFLVISLRKEGTDNNINSSTVVINLLPAPTSTPSTPPTITSFPTFTPAPIQKAVYKINKVKDENGTELTSVKIYVDNVYTHHEDAETLTFCDGCHCDNDNSIDCGFGEHTIKLQKDGYPDWSERKTFSSGNNFEVNPIMSKINPTSTSAPVPTSTPLPSSTPKLTITPKPTLVNSILLASASAEEVLGTDSSKQPIDENLSNVSNAEAKSNFDILPILFIAPGTLMIGFAIFMFLKSKHRAVP